MTDYYLAQCNIARAHAPLDQPLMADFVGQLAAINALAESAPGFIWRLKDDTDNATAIQVFDDARIIVNMSVWESIEALAAFTFKADHAAALRRRTEWFERMAGPHMALWWLAAGSLPGAEDIPLRLNHLAQCGPTPFAFTFKNPFAKPATQPAERPDPKPAE